MTPRRTPPSWLTAAFRTAGLRSHMLSADDPCPAMRLNGDEESPACWLWQFDPLERPCSGRLEAIHLISQQRIEKVIKPLIFDWPLEDASITSEDIADLVELAEWDPRNVGLGCTGHHRRTDHQATPGLSIPAAGLRVETFEFIAERGLEFEAERRFDDFDPAVLGAGVPIPQGPEGSASTPICASAEHSGSEAA